MLMGLHTIYLYRNEFAEDMRKVVTVEPVKDETDMRKTTEPVAEKDNRLDGMAAKKGAWFIRKMCRDIALDTVNNIEKHLLFII